MTIRSGRDDPSFEKSTRLLGVSGGERKIKTSMNTGGCAAQKCYMLRSQKVVQNSTYKWVNNLFVRVRSDIRDLQHRQRNARRRRSQPKEDWVEGFVLGEKNNI